MLAKESQLLSFGHTGGVATVTPSWGSELVVQLSTNPSTGYDWVTTNDIPSCLSLVSTEELITADRIQIGSPHILQYVYETIAVCSGDLEYVYMRPWEGLNSESSRVTIHVRISPAIEL